MATNASSTASTGDLPVVTEVPHRDYAFYGRDAKGEYHHYDSSSNRILVTTGRYEQFTPEGTTRPSVRILGDVVREVDLDSPEYADKRPQDWIPYVAARRGWAQRHRSVLSTVAEALRSSSITN